MASYIALHLVFGDSLSGIPELTGNCRLIGLPASFQDLPVSVHPSTRVTDVYQDQLLHGCWVSHYGPQFSL